MPLDQKTLILFLFGAIIAITFVKLLFRGKNASVFDQKILGGFTVFLVALVADSPAVYAVSFFIGGLLIATENFLIHLAGIFKADKKDVSAITKDYSLSKLSEPEVEDKIENEAIEAVAESTEVPTVRNEKQAQEVRKKIGSVVNTVKSVEEGALRLVRQRLDIAHNPYILSENIRVEGDDYIKIFDAIIKRSGDKNIYAAVEVKYFDKYSLEKIKDYFINQVAYNAYKVLFMIVLPRIKENEKEEIHQFIATVTVSNPGIGIVVCRYEEGEVSPVLDVDLKRFFPAHLKSTAQKSDALLSYYKRLVDKNRGTILDNSGPSSARKKRK